jgi:hypothetical protein
VTPLLQKEKVTLKAKAYWIYKLETTVCSDRLFYEINYNSSLDKGKIIFSELIGESSAKLVRIDLNTNKNIKTGEFNTEKPFANIYFEVQRIRFYSDTDLDFELSVYVN